MQHFDEMADFQDFFATVRTLYRELPFLAPGLREKLAALAKAASLPSASTLPGPAKIQAIDSLINDFPVFGKDLLIALAKHFAGLRSFVEQRELHLSRNETNLAISEANYKRQDASLGERDILLTQRRVALDQEAATLRKRSEGLEERDDALTKGHHMLLERQQQGMQLGRKFQCTRFQCSFVIIRDTKGSKTPACPYCRAQLAAATKNTELAGGQDKRNSRDGSVLIRGDEVCFFASCVASVCCHCKSRRIFNPTRMQTLPHTTRDVTA